ncbi:hypothetical protein F183_A17610 [Bryobacterales bacterium F-183]|nr:hypothetical protein F183_A17610 [Bryobacterales bacterium F-183]
MALFLLLPLTVVAQIRVAAVDPVSGTETNITGALYSMGTPGPSDEVRTRFRIYNTTNAPLTIQRVRVSGTGFSMSEPSPTVVASGRSLDVTVLFVAARSGGYSATFTADSFSVLLTATVAIAPTVTAARGGTPIGAGSSIDIGSANSGQTVTKTIWLENRESLGLTVRSLRVTGDGLSLAPGTPATLAIAAGQAESIVIRFQPTGASRRYAGSLIMDGRMFVLAAIGTDPPLPRPSIEIDGTAASGQSPKLSVQFATVPETDANGTLRMEFQPLPSVTTSDDSAIRFLSSNGRNLPVQVRRGQAKAFFGTAANAAQDAVFQTGSTAGTITWTLEIGSFKEVRTMQLSPAAANVAESRALRRVQDLDVTVTGFDNTRSMNQLAFTFYDTSGREVAPGAIRVDVRQEFSRFFSTSSTGGVFTLRASFPVSGGAASQIGSVDVELVNSAGTSRTQRLTIAGN